MSLILQTIKELIMGEVLWLNLFLGLVVVGFFVDKLLEFLNVQHWKNEIPDKLKGFYDQQKYEKSRAYQIEKGKIAFYQSILSLLITVLALLLGWLGSLDEFIGSFVDMPFARSGFFFIIIFFISDFLALPFSIYSVFSIEQRYGFNKTTIATFIFDKIKGYLMTLIIGGGLFYFSFFVIAHVSDGYWLWLWIGFSFFMLLVNMFYADLILPIFNKLSPLNEGALKEDIYAFTKKVGYSIKNIYIIDGSKRSTKSNAFFSGLGPRKTIALYDNLIDKHTNQEIVAILAHEIGHYKRKHILTSFLLSILQMGITFYLLELFLFQPNIALALGANEPSFHIGLIAFGLIFSPFSLIIGILMNILSRKNEFEADAYAKQNYNARDLSLALKKLSVDSLSNLSPHKAYVFVHYSHPPLLERLKALD